jgi:hypothetical protein
MQRSVSKIRDIERKKRAEKLYVLLLNYRLSDMSCDYLACKIRELRGENTILISAYELEGNMVTNLKHKKNLTLLMGRIEQYV